MLAVVSSHAPIGMEGELVSVEVDIRRGLPGIDVVGLPDGAVRESKERVRVAIRNSGFSFPPERILISLAPAGVRKEGASFDLPIALGILAASGQILPEGVRHAMVLGELNLGGGVRPVHGVLSAVGTGLAAGLSTFLVPRENLREARALGKGSVAGISSLREAALALSHSEDESPGDRLVLGEPDQALSRTGLVRRRRPLRYSRSCPAQESAGGGGRRKTPRAAFRTSGERKDHGRAAASVPPAGAGQGGSARSDTHPFHCRRVAIRCRSRVPPPVPHAAPLRIKRGNNRRRKAAQTGEASLAHHGILFLDEAPEFGMRLLQSLREPIEDGWISIARAGSTVRYPACLQLVLAFNPCPCGNLGRANHACVCSLVEVNRYWRRVGGALLDRIDVRVPLSPVPPSEMCAPVRHRRLG